MKKLRILLTGGNGFIGKNIQEILSNKYTLIAPTVSQLNLLNIDSTNNFLTRRGYFDVVIHSANVGGKRNKKDDATIVYKNTSMFFNLIRNKNCFKKLINLGSGAEYGKDKPLVKVLENEFGKNVPKDYYGFSKFIISNYLETSGFGINLRLFGVYGKYEDTNIRFIPYVINRILDRKSIIINNNVFFDYLYVNDLVRIIEYFINNKSRFISYNIGTGQAISLLALANKIVKVLKSNSKIILKTKTPIFEYSCNNQRLLDEVGKFEFTSFEDSIRYLYNWYSPNHIL